MGENVAAPAAAFDPGAPAVVIHQLTVLDADVVMESRRWTTGRRGATVPVESMQVADLAPFVTQALAVGARAIASAGSAQDTFQLERLITEVAAKTSESTSRAAEATSKAASGAADAMATAAEAARRAIADGETASRKGQRSASASSIHSVSATLRRCPNTKCVVCTV